MKVWVPSDLSAQVNLGCDSHQTIHNYNLYVATFLGFGGNAARDRYTDFVITQNNTLDIDVWVLLELWGAFSPIKYLFIIVNWHLRWPDHKAKILTNCSSNYYNIFSLFCFPLTKFCFGPTVSNMQLPDFLCFEFLCSGFLPLISSILFTISNLIDMFWPIYSVLFFHL